MRSATIVVDLGFGDAGKGSVTDWLSRRSPSSTVVRYNGGPQAAHNVVTPDGRHHTFAQFGAGAFAGARTHLSRFMLVNPLNLFAEAEALGKLIHQPLLSLTLSPRAKIITPWHKAVNRARERKQRHGSCAHGVGEAMRLHENRPDLTLYAGSVTSKAAEAVRRALFRELWEVELSDFSEEAHVFQDRQVMRNFLAAHAALVDGRLLEDDDLLSTGQDFIFEGAQGVLLDEAWGFHPYTTWSTTTTANAEELLQPWPDIAVTKLGLTRAFPTRHGPGPFPTEDRSLQQTDHNVDNEWQGRWRIGHPDLVLLKYAIAATGGIDELGITCLDKGTPTKVCTAYTIDDYDRAEISGNPESLDYQLQLGRALEECGPVYEQLGMFIDYFPEWLAASLEVPLGVLSHGPTADDKRRP